MFCLSTIMHTHSFEKWTSTVLPACEYLRVRMSGAPSPRRLRQSHKFQENGPLFGVFSPRVAEKTSSHVNGTRFSGAQNVSNALRSSSAEALQRLLNVMEKLGLMTRISSSRLGSLQGSPWHRAYVPRAECGT